MKIFHQLVIVEIGVEIMNVKNNFKINFIIQKFLDKKNILQL
jgi:hypothetical protein